MARFSQRFLGDMETRALNRELGLEWAISPVSRREAIQKADSRHEIDSLRPP
jgi:hypothetical protein